MTAEEATEREASPIRHSCCSEKMDATLAVDEEAQPNEASTDSSNPQADDAEADSKRHSESQGGNDTSDGVVNLLQGDICIDGETEIDDLWVAARIAKLESTRLKEISAATIYQPLPVQRTKEVSSDEESEYDGEMDELLPSGAPERKKDPFSKGPASDCEQQNNENVDVSSLVDDDEGIEGSNEFVDDSTNEVVKEGLDDGAAFMDDSMMSEERPNLTKAEQKVLSTIQKIEVNDLPSFVEAGLPIEIIGVSIACVDDMVIVRSTLVNKALDLGSILCLGNREIIGPISDTFGPVSLPHYVVYLEDKQKGLKSALVAETEVYCDASHSSFIMDRSHPNACGNIEELKKSFESESDSDNDNEEEDAMYTKSTLNGYPRNTNKSVAQGSVLDPVKESYHTITNSSNQPPAQNYSGNAPAVKTSLETQKNTDISMSKQKEAPRRQGKYGNRYKKNTAVAPLNQMNRRLPHSVHPYAHLGWPMFGSPPPPPPRRAPSNFDPAYTGAPAAPPPSAPHLLMRTASPQVAPPYSMVPSYQIGNNYPGLTPALRGAHDTRYTTSGLPTGSPLGWIQPPPPPRPRNKFPKK